MKVKIDETIRKRDIIKVLSYPKGDLEYALEVVRELKDQKIEELVFTGNVKINKIQVLGKGTTSLVLKGTRLGETVALKILRVDANRETLELEADNLKIANGVGVGPNLISHGCRSLIMEYVDGRPILDFLKHIFEEHKIEDLKTVFKKSLIQAFHLDRVSLDHGELSHANKHIFVIPENEVKIIDFESASTKRKPSNLTSLTQFFLIRNEYASKIRESLGIKDLGNLFQLLRKYKKEKTSNNFKLILRELNLL